MTTGKLVSQLESFVKKLELLVQNLKSSSFRPSKVQYLVLEELSRRLSNAAQVVPAEIEAIKKKHTESSCEEGRELLAQAQSDRGDIIATSQLKSRGLFARNITLFFEGQKNSIVDSSATQARKKLTGERCERIRNLNPDGLISWATAFTPTTWTANLMSKDAFDYVVKNIEPNDAQVWPSDIYHILRGLEGEEPLRECHKYHEFLKAAEDEMKSAQSLNQSRKRKRVVDEPAPETPQSPVGELATRDMQTEGTVTQRVCASENDQTLQTSSTNDAPEPSIAQTGTPAHDVSSLGDTSSFDMHPFLDLQTADLFNFLEKHQGEDRSLRMMCPYAGSPLPWIEVRFKRSKIVEANIQISWLMSRELIKFVLENK